jgi:alpha-tubulin suppressor-like RCC1 family protein
VGKVNLEYMDAVLKTGGHLTRWEVSGMHSSRIKVRIFHSNNIEIKYISAGQEHAAAIDQSGVAWLWGRNQHG